MEISDHNIMEKCVLLAGCPLQANLHRNVIFITGFIYLIYWQPEGFELMLRASQDELFLLIFLCNSYRQLLFGSIVLGVNKLSDVP